MAATKQELWEAFQGGFSSSAEGWNGEYPDYAVRDPETLRRFTEWMKRKKAKAKRKK
jgi:hypothetical protein